MHLTICCAAVIAAAAFAPAAPEPAQEPTANVQFSDAYRMVLLADSAYEKEEWSRARDFYSQALDTYATLRRKFPDWQPGVVDFKIRYCMRRLDLLPPAPPAETNALSRTASPSVTSPQAAPETAPSETDLRAAKALDNLIEASRRQLLVGNVAAARDGLLSALRISPDHPTIRLLLGLAQCRNGQFEDAVTLLDNLIEDEPNNAWAHLYRGTARVGMGRIDEAVADIEKATRLNPRSHEAYYDLAQALLMKSPPDTANAQKHYRKAIELGATPDPALEARLKPAPAPR